MTKKYTEAECRAQNKGKRDKNDINRSHIKAFALEKPIIKNK